MKNNVHDYETWLIFEKIASRYDLTNHILSLGIDYFWRKKVSSIIVKEQEITIVDLATGTGDLLLAILKDHPNIVRALGIDMSPKMLSLAEAKFIKKKNYLNTSLRLGDVGCLPLNNNDWDYVTIAFGIRNTSDTFKSLQEMYRVLKTGGKVIVLEFSLPKNFFFRNIYLIYFRYILPWLGFLITRELGAYKYLNNSVENFPHGESFIILMEQAGFVKCQQYPLTFGIASIYIGQK
jgi:demethylmenaquinone methyltransferase/2-methoxy-6-polyprenyl-1,4-benzoquinol methylase